MEATLEIATHFRDGTNLVGAEIAPELNYLLIVYWSKNLKWHSPRKIWKLQRGLTNPIAFKHLQLILLALLDSRKKKLWIHKILKVLAMQSLPQMFILTESWCAVFWQPRTFTVRSDVHRQVDNLRAVTKNNNIFWHRKPRNADALVISVETNHLTERCFVTWHRAKWSNFWVRFLAVI